MRTIHRPNTGARGRMGMQACQFVVGDFENKNKKIQTRVLGVEHGEFGKHLPANVAIKDYLHMEGVQFSWDEMNRQFPRRIRHDNEVWRL